MKFSAFWVEKDEEGVSHSVITRSTDDLPDSDVLIKVEYSSVNYKDALSAKGMPGVTREYPHTPGIDAAGTVVASKTAQFAEGDQVITVGFDLGMNTPGGYGEYICVPASTVTPMPADLNTRDAMILGTAGLTAALCVDKLLRMNAVPADGPVLVTGATGGVGSVAVALLAKLGFTVTAMSGKAEKADYLRTLGASEVIAREPLSDENNRPMLAPAYGHAVDTVGGDILSNTIKSLNYGGSVAICGLVASPAIKATVLPFILRGVNVLGIDSVELPIEEKNRMWQLLATEWKLDSLNAIASEVDLNGLSAVIDAIFTGQVTGRTLVTHQ